MAERVTIIGGGLAGSECALSLARRGVPVELIEMRPCAFSPAHHSDRLAELVCSNSFKSFLPGSAAGLLKCELLYMGSQLLPLVLQARVPAGGALAVDRDIFSRLVTQAVEREPAIEVIRKEACELPENTTVIAAGPLCSKALLDTLIKQVGGRSLYFFDAAAPIVDATTIDRSVVFAQSRRGGHDAGDYLNCPMSKVQYDAFVEQLAGAHRVIARDFENKELFGACQPVEEVARGGMDSLRFGALKPVGLIDPRSGHRPWAVVQLRAENKACTSYNLVGFQTNLTWSEQKRVFRMIPGLEQAEFFRYGVMHRNTYIDAPRALDTTFRIPGTTFRLAGQITGTEGYTEAIASGLLAALNTYADLRNLAAVTLPPTGALGSLVAYATDPATLPYQPMHVNFGLVPPLGGPRLSKRDRYAAYTFRARGDLEAYVSKRDDVFGPWAGIWPDSEVFK